MSQVNQNPKLLLNQTLYQVFQLRFAVTPLLVNKAPYQADWQALGSKCHWAGEQEVKAESKIEEGVKG